MPGSGRSWIVSSNSVRSGTRDTLACVSASDDDWPAQRNGKLRIPLPFEDAVKAGLETPPPKRIEKAKKARVASRSKRKPKS